MLLAHGHGEYTDNLFYLEFICYANPLSLPISNNNGVCVSHDIN